MACAASRARLVDYARERGLDLGAVVLGADRACLTSKEVAGASGIVAAVKPECTYRVPVIGKAVILFVVRSSKYILLTVGRVLPCLVDHRRKAALLPSLDKHKLVA